ncbi:MAG: lysylphosphatidylglycerol synthase transmembrane domain-containing protein [bacterium]
MKKILLFLVFLSVGAWLFWEISKIVGWEEIRRGFLAFTGYQGIIILGLTFLTVLIGTWRWKVILKTQEIDISLKELFKPYLLGFSMMYLFPIAAFGGEAFRSYFLKSKNRVPWSKGMASVFIDRILEWTVNLIVMFFGIGFFLFTISLPPRNSVIIFLPCFLFFIVLTVFFYFKTFKKESVVKNILKINNRQAIEVEKEIFDFFKPREASMWKGFALSFLRGGVMFLRNWLLILFLAKNIGFWPSLSILGFSYLAATIPIPAALGSHELIQFFAFNGLGLKIGTAAAFTMIIRGAEVIVSLTGIVILFHTGLEILRKNLFVNNK